eukprot:1376350-Rhodomonas_salina.1
MHNPDHPKIESESRARQDCFLNPNLRTLPSQDEAHLQQILRGVWLDTEEEHPPKTISALLAVILNGIIATTTISSSSIDSIRVTITNAPSRECQRRHHHQHQPDESNRALRPSRGGGSGGGAMRAAQTRAASAAALLAAPPPSPLPPQRADADQLRCDDWVRDQLCLNSDAMTGLEMSYASER